LGFRQKGNYDEFEVIKNDIQIREDFEENKTDFNNIFDSYFTANLYPEYKPQHFICSVWTRGGFVGWNWIENTLLKEQDKEIITTTNTNVKQNDDKVLESDILGNGYGTCHNWEKITTFQVGSTSHLKGTNYKCRQCHMLFLHRYAYIPNIYKAMESENIPNECI
jgi:hypothetical protein